MSSPGILDESYKYGFESDVEMNVFKKGLNEDVIKAISAKKKEPNWLLDFRLDAYKKWTIMTEPHWPDFEYEPIDYQALSYFAEPKKNIESLDELPQEIKSIYERLGIPLEEQELLEGVKSKGYAVDAVLDSVSVATTFKKQLEKYGVIFCSFSEAVQRYPDIVQKYLASVVPASDNYFACLNSAVFSDGSFAYIPKGVKCPLDLSSYFRINALNTGQFERTLIVAEEDSYVSYLEGCSAPMRKNNQLHAAVVEIVAAENAEVKYSTIQNWYPGDKDGVGGVYNFVTKRGLCKGKNSKISWTQMETGANATWKYPSCILMGDGSTGEFYSIAVTNNFQKTDTGTKMIHLGKNTKSKIISKTISAKNSRNAYRGMVKVSSKATNAKNYSTCDSLIFGPDAVANTFPVIESKRGDCSIEHEASTSKVNQDQLNYMMQRGLNEEEATNMVVTGFSREILQHLPLEFAIEAQKLLQISFEGSVG